MSSSLQGDPAPDSLPRKDLEGLEELRDILLRGDQPYLSETVESVLDGAMARKIDESKNEMAAVLAPVMGQAIRQQASEAQDDIIDALHPVIGRTIQRSAAESMRALARRVDQKLRSTLSIRRLLRRLQARIRGVPGSELFLRDSIPLGVQEVLLIHRDSGLLLEHLAREPEEATDRDLVSNAPRFTPSGGQVSIDVMTLDDALAVEISDAGPASLQKTRPASCSSSFALTSRGSSGFPVLAWVCPSFGAIVEQHGGEAYCRSQPGEGGTFGFTLPVTGE